MGHASRAGFVVVVPDDNSPPVLSSCTVQLGDAHLMNVDATTIVSSRRKAMNGQIRMFEVIPNATLEYSHTSERQRNYSFDIELQT